MPLGYDILRRSPSASPQLTSGLRRRSSAPTIDEDMSQGSSIGVRHYPPTPLAPSREGPAIPRPECQPYLPVPPSPESPSSMMAEFSTDSNGGRDISLVTAPDTPSFTDTDITSPKSKRPHFPLGQYAPSLKAPEFMTRNFSDGSDCSDKTMMMDDTVVLSKGSGGGDGGRPRPVLEKYTQKWPIPRSRSMSQGAGGAEGGRGLRLSVLNEWTVFKWVLLLSVMMVLVYGTGMLVIALMTWLRTWSAADVMIVADNDILIIITLTSSLLVFASFVGLAGILLNSRAIMAVYTVLLWPALISLLTVGYMSYRRGTFSLDHKLNLSWSRYYTSLGRRMIQDSLDCCGYYGPLHQGTASKRCYLRAPLPGCKARLYQFEQATLTMLWRTAFGLVPIHFVNIFVALISSNHLTKSFGKGVLPPPYRLVNMDVKVEAERLLKAGRGLAGNAPVSMPLSRMERIPPDLLPDSEKFF